jgi:3-oxoacyl-[acyl-carrier protein] reductase
MNMRRNVIVSGGSRGRGLAIGRHLLEQGHAVGTFARNRTPAIDRLAAEHRGSLWFRDCDGRDLAAVEALLREVEAAAGPLHALVNNAAIGQDNLLVHLKPEKIGDILAINVEAPILLTRSFVRRALLAGGGARIVNISSICGSRGFQGLTVYSATKGAMDAFTRSLAREMGSRGILVNSIVPGFFESDMSQVLAPSQLEAIRRRTATGRMTDEEQILPVLDMLLFADTNVTGQSFVVDGGSIA